jgi:hypothetical protein
MKESDIAQIHSRDLIYSEHHIDECFEYRDGGGRVPEGDAVGIVVKGRLHLFGDIKYSEANHEYWDNYELENDPERLVLPQ